MSRFEVIVDGLAHGAVLVTLRGELAFEQAYTFDEQLRRIEETAPPCIVLDLRGLDFVDSSGLGRLLAARRRAARARRRLVLVRGGRSLQRLIALSGLADAFELVDAVPAELGLPLRAPAH